MKTHSSQLTAHSSYCHYLTPYASRDGEGHVLAPCGAIVRTTTRFVQGVLSSSILSDVTCAGCRERIAAVGKEYQKARRAKEIDW